MNQFTNSTIPQPVFPCATCGNPVEPTKSKRPRVGAISKKPVCKFHYDQEFREDLAAFEREHCLADNDWDWW